MKARLWVGGVKSTSPIGLLEDAFGRFGKISKAEAGFPGFAFLEFEDGADAVEATQKLDKTYLQGIGKIHVASATCRGYEEACKKRDDYWQTKGYEVAHRGSPARNRSNSPRGRCRSSSSSHSAASKVRSGSRCSRSRSRSRSWKRGGPSRRGTPKKPARRSASKSRSPQSGERARSCSQRRNRAEGTLEDVPAALENGVARNGNDNHKDRIGDPTQEHEPVWFSDVDRAAILGFFDGATTYDMLVESASVSKAHNPERISSFPRAFPDADEEIQVAMLTAFGGFSSDACKEKRGMCERSVEVRQTVIVEPDGLRLLRKTLVVDGTVCYSEDKSL